MRLLNPLRRSEYLHDCLKKGDEYFILSNVTISLLYVLVTCEYSRDLRLFAQRMDILLATNIIGEFLLLLFISWVNEWVSEGL